MGKLAIHGDPNGEMLPKSQILVILTGKFIFNRGSNGTILGKMEI